VIKVWDFQPIKASAVEMWRATLNFKPLPKQALCSVCLKLQHHFSAQCMPRASIQCLAQWGASCRVWQSPVTVERGGETSSLNKEVGWEIFVSLPRLVQKYRNRATALSSAWCVSCMQLCPHFHENLCATGIRAESLSAWISSSRALWNSCVVRRMAPWKKPGRTVASGAQITTNRSFTAPEWSRGEGKVLLTDKVQQCSYLKFTLPVFWTWLQPVTTQTASLLFFHFP